MLGGVGRQLNVAAVVCRGNRTPLCRRRARSRGWSARARCRRGVQTRGRFVGVPDDFAGGVGLVGDSDADPAVVDKAGAVEIHLHAEVADVGGAKPVKFGPFVGTWTPEAGRPPSTWSICVWSSSIKRLARIHFPLPLKIVAFLEIESLAWTNRARRR